MEKERKLVTSQELPVYMSRSLCHLRCRKASWWWFLPKIPHQYHWNMIRIHLPVYFMTWSEQAEAPVAWVFLVWSMPVTQWQESCRILCVCVGSPCQNWWRTLVYDLMISAYYGNPLPTAGCRNFWHGLWRWERIHQIQWFPHRALLVTKNPTCSVHLSQTMISLLTRRRGTRCLDE